MCEIPNNVIQVDAFAAVFDGFSIGSDPDIARFLTGLGIDSISVNPSSLLRTIRVVHEAEGGQQETKAREFAATGG